MSKCYNCILLILSLLATASCSRSNSESESVEVLQNKIDSLQTANEAYTALLDAVVLNIDSVIGADQSVLAPHDIESTNPRQLLLDKLDACKGVVDRQRARIEELEKNLRILKNGDSRYAGIIAHLKQQIQQKDAEIAALKESVERGNTNIAQLTTQMSGLKQSVTELQATTSAQEEALAASDQMLNTAYYFIGDKKQLEALGVLKGGGFLKKKKLDLSAADASRFTEIDIREKTSFRINGKKPKVISPMPADSYTITTDPDGKSTLTVTDISKFWSVTSYLIIQYK